MPQPDILRQRLHTQHLAGEPLPRPEDVVHFLGAVQSQDYPGASWSLGQRVHAGTQALVDDALARGTILRIHALRPTWHFVTPADIRWILQLTAPRVHALNAYQNRKVEVDVKVLARSHKVIARALEGGHQRTRAELAKALERAGIVGDGQRIAQIMMWAELEAVVCSGALRGKQHTYALLEERVPPARAMTRDEALAEFVRRFFVSHGPATIAHFVWWSGLTVADAKKGVAMVGSELSDRVVKDRAEWLASKSAPLPRTKEPVTAYLIPEYDELLIGWRELEVQTMAADMPALRGKDAFYRPLIIDGKRAGSWRRTIVGKSAVLEARLVAPLNRAQTKALRTVVAKYADFLGKPVTLVET